MAALVLFSGLVHEKQHVHKWPFRIVILGNWQEFPSLGDPRGLLKNARTKSSMIPYLQPDTRCPRIQSMFEVVLDILEQNESPLSVLFNYLGAIKCCHIMWLAVFPNQLVIFKMMKNEKNISKILLLDNSLSTDILVHSSDWIHILVDWKVIL